MEIIIKDDSGKVLDLLIQEINKKLIEKDRDIKGLEYNHKFEFNRAEKFRQRVRDLTVAAENRISILLEKDKVIRSLQEQNRELQRKVDLLNYESKIYTRFN